MNTQNITFCIIVLVAVSLVLGIVYVRIGSLEYENFFTFEHVVSIKKDEIFKLMSDVEIYPVVLSDNYKSVKILENYTNVMIYEETVQERGIVTTLVVKHTLTNNDIHQIEILDGDAKGSTITTKFTAIDHDSTQISTTMDLQLKGILGVFSNMTNTNYQSAFTNILRSFEQYYVLTYD